MSFTVEPIGVVRSSIADPRQMPGDGVPASVEVYPPYAAALAGLADSSYVSITAWLEGANQGQLVAKPKGVATERGVFATRSPGRPNPIGVSMARITAVEGQVIRVEALDFVDGTPVLDLKSPLRGWDYAWSAVGFRDAQFVHEPDSRWALGLLLREAEGFHGERCPGLALGVRLVWHALRHFGVPARDPHLSATVGVDGCVADAVQSLLGATLGNGRLRPSSATAFHLQYDEKELVYFLHDLADRDADAVLAAAETMLFGVQEQSADHGDVAPLEPARPLVAEQRAEVLAAIHGALLNGKLPCPVAFKLARQLGAGTRHIGQLANEDGIRVSSCQLGCFR